jgi:hypothetical protein
LKKATPTPEQLQNYAPNQNYEILQTIVFNHNLQVKCRAHGCNQLLQSVFDFEKNKPLYTETIYRTKGHNANGYKNFKLPLIYATATLFNKQILLQHNSLRKGSNIEPITHKNVSIYAGFVKNQLSMLVDEYNEFCDEYKANAVVLSDFKTLKFSQKGIEKPLNWSFEFADMLFVYFGLFSFCQNFILYKDAATGKWIFRLIYKNSQHLITVSQSEAAALATCAYYMHNSKLKLGLHLPELVSYAVCHSNMSKFYSQDLTASLSTPHVFISAPKIKTLKTKNLESANIGQIFADNGIIYRYLFIYKDNKVQKIENFADKQTCLNQVLKNLGT